VPGRAVFASPAEMDNRNINRNKNKISAAALAKN
jgi:hypothetical protein